MNKTELVDAIAKESGLTKTDSEKALNGFIKAVEDVLKKGDKLALVGFGTFSVSERAAREGINPRTKAKIQIPAKKIAKFKAGAKLLG
ncbi:MAG: HU family DNA-binding protein [Paludibacteraceae bacterium]|jgi:DNA-binding protein HU-beta|nr:HU family DNA-binding protein [Paludibacteraceae bacterium]